MKNKTITSYIIGTVAIIGIAAGSAAYAQGGMMGQTTQKSTQNDMHGQSTQGNMMGQTNQKAASNNMMGQTNQKGTVNNMHGQTQTAKKDIRDTMHGNTSTTSAMADHHNSK